MHLVELKGYGAEKPVLWARQGKQGKTLTCGVGWGAFKEVRFLFLNKKKEAKWSMVATRVCVQGGVVASMASTCECDT